MPISNPASFRQQVASSGMPEAIEYHEANSVDRHMKRAMLKLYRSARDPGEWTMDFSAISDRGLVLWGAKDEFAPVEIARRFSERWGIALAVEEEAGHWGIRERLDALASHLKAHWRSRG